MTSLEKFYERQFKAFPATVPAQFPTKPVLRWRDQKSTRNYRTTLLREWKVATKPNFAGHYFAIHHIGCGTSCEVIFIVDWNTGKIISAPEDQVFQVRLSSRLLILKSFEECTALGEPILYEFKDEKFRRIGHSSVCE